MAHTTHLETPTTDLPREKLLDMLRQMHLIRAFEEAAEQQYFAGKVHGTMHLYIGEEAAAVGCIAALEPRDQITSTHRGHGHAIAKGQDVREMMAELLAKRTGVCRGLGGSMHMADVELGNLGANGIVSGGMGSAVGAALSTHLLKTGRVVMCFFGDGAANNGNFHETLNLASIWKLPVVFVCENNQYAMSMPAREAIPVRVADRAAAYAMPGVRVDGMDVLAVYAEAKRAVDRARAGQGPSLVEVLTYRYKGHSRSDKQVYRTKQEVKEWQERDPIARFEAWLIENGLLGREQADAVRQEALRAIEEAVAFADASPEPDPAALLDEVYYEEPANRMDHALRGLTLQAPSPFNDRPLPTWFTRTFAQHAGSEPPPGTRELTGSEALREAMAQAMEAAPNVVLIGEDIGKYGGAFGVTLGLYDRFGPDRVRDTPISENAIAGVSFGAGMTGLIPIAEFQFQDFVTLAMEQIVLQAAKVRYMFGGRTICQMVIRLPAGGGTGAAAQHSESLESWFVNVPGLKVVIPSTPYDMKGLLLASIADQNPIIFVEPKLAYRIKGPVPERPYLVPIGKAAVRRVGRHLTLVSAGMTVHRALEAAEQLAGEGIDCEVIDLRTLKPYDLHTIVQSVKKTGRVLIAHEAPLLGGYGAEIAAAVAQSEAFAYLEAPIIRLGGADTPMPYNRTMERAATPQTEHIVEHARKLARLQV
ncbi:MAG: dehydrogenase [Chloroflexi bacterium]|jgi:pyruvate dehydrogenase E1 component alpha subunit|uniref:Dehydrogenase n=1 Tax=Candidatus Thermofonsia Clade 3 bacterium TaxID=2364212 RepID=A0A2M8QCJ1_9CHLR|nr:pyruvate dehydrogenase complex E1 component subunit beta [Candidatus Roseilinea sp. NK_OTU-006]PJF47517.1 MAG: dehydrogenase [Candidatus Thermofonsia Clade 3 bacterium]RMG63896.1 MAG: dehydrogenase [Chloroflexota bacterium]